MNNFEEALILIVFVAGGMGGVVCISVSCSLFINKIKEYYKKNNEHNKYIKHDPIIENSNVNNI